MSIFNVVTEKIALVPALVLWFVGCTLIEAWFTVIVWVTSVKLPSSSVILNVLVSVSTLAPPSVTSPDIDKNGFVYRVIVSHSSGVLCSVLTSNEATLNINVGTVITNRRITYRVNKN